MSTPGHSQPLPTLDTPRLRLRALTADDVPSIHRLADNSEVAAGLSDLPHPYPREAAVGLVQGMARGASTGSALALGIELKQPVLEDTILGIVFLISEQSHQRAELIYWLGRPYWGNGYATEAVRAVLRFGFETLGLNRVHATCFTRNPASARVMQKAGMTFEGVMRQHLVKGGEPLDLASYGILRSDPNAL